MLINLESLSVERIFQMLKMFAMQGSAAPAAAAVGTAENSAAAACDIDVVRQFLDKKVREHELVYSGGQYRLPQNN